MFSERAAYFISMFFYIRAFRTALAQDAPYRLAVEVNNLQYGQEGKIVLEVHPDWAPKAAKRFRSLSEDNAFDNAWLFKVSPGFTARVYLGGNVSQLPNKWRDTSAPDDIRSVSNTRGKVVFASDKSDSPRSAHLIVNIYDNKGHDSRGLAPFAEIVEGMHIFEQLYSGYGMVSTTVVERLAEEGTAYLQRSFAKLSRVKTIKDEATKYSNLLPSDNFVVPFLIHICILASIIISGGWALFHLTMFTASDLADKGLLPEADECDKTGSFWQFLRADGCNDDFERKGLAKAA